MGKVGTFAASGDANDEKVPASDAKIVDFINDKII